MASFEEYINYRDQLISDIRLKKSTYKLNSDCGHNAMVLSAMLKTSSNIEMLCGRMSPFRNSLYSHLSEDLVDSGEMDKQNADQISEDIKKEMIESYKDFFKNQDAQFNVFVIDYKEDLQKEFIDEPLFKKAVSEGKLNIYKFNEDFYGREYLHHTSMGDQAIVRLEDDNEKHSAMVFVMPQSNILKSMNKTYSTLKKTTTKLASLE